MEERVAIFPGSFDPFTLGHEDIVRRGLRMFSKVVVAIGYNSSKHKRYFEIDFMIEKIAETFKDVPERVEVITYNELTAQLARKYSAKFVLRGLRNTTDFEYENTISQVNRKLNADLETVFLITSPELAPISSTIIREVHRYNGDVSGMLPYEL